MDRVIKCQWDSLPVAGAGAGPDHAHLDPARFSLYSEENICEIS
jgi:hypothetical protein